MSFVRSVGRSVVRSFGRSVGRSVGPSVRRSVGLGGRGIFPLRSAATHQPSRFVTRPCEMNVSISNVKL